LLQRADIGCVPGRRPAASPSGGVRHLLHSMLGS
jgi:hypothetical protein